MTPCRARIRDDPVCAERPVEPVTPRSARGIDGLRIAVAGGYFRRRASPKRWRRHRSRRRGARRQARDRNSRSRARARGGLCHHRDRRGGLHLDRLRTRAERFRSGRARPADRRRHAAGFAGRSRRRNSAAGIASRCSSCSTDVDAILAPATPCTAPLIGQQTFMLDGVEMPLRANHRHLHAADLVHRPAGRGGAGAAVAACRSACRSLPRPGARTSRCALRMRWSSKAWRRRSGRRSNSAERGYRRA